MKQTIILEDLRFDFTELELAKFITYWKEYSKNSDDTIEIVRQIARDVRMNVDNVFIVILHLKRVGKI